MEWRTRGLCWDGHPSKKKTQAIMYYILIASHCAISHRKALTRVYIVVSNSIKRSINYSRCFISHSHQRNLFWHSLGSNQEPNKEPVRISHRLRERKSISAVLRCFYLVYIKISEDYTRRVSVSVGMERLAALILIHPSYISFSICIIFITFIFPPSLKKKQRSPNNSLIYCQRTT